MKLRRIAWWAAAAVAVALAAAFVVAWTAGNACDGRTAPKGAAIRGIVRCDYGGPGVVQLQEIDKPTPGPDEVLVRVRAASVNPLDWHFMEGTPYVARVEMGLRKPRSIRLGVDFAGTVEAVGADVKKLRPGDEVFGGRTGAFAEYVAVREDRAIAPKPANLTFEEAAAVPIAAITALQGLRDSGKVKPGQKVLINGASGGVGTFAVQIAKALGADVTGVCSTRNVALVRSLGADRVIDYTREDFTTTGQRWDVILDNVGNHSLLECRRALAPNGRYVMVGGQPGRWLAPLPRALGALVLSRFVGQDLRMFLAELNGRDLAVLGELLQARKVKPVIDRRYPLGEAAAALRYVEEGHARGKVVLTPAAP